MAKLTVDTNLVDVLADLMEKKGLTEVEVTVGDQTLRLSKGGTAQAVTHVAAAPVAAPAAPAAMAPAAAAAAPPQVTSARTSRVKPRISASSPEISMMPISAMSKI